MYHRFCVVDVVVSVSTLNGKSTCGSLSLEVSPTCVHWFIMVLVHIVQVHTGYHDVFPLCCQTFNGDKDFILCFVSESTTSRVCYVQGQFIPGDFVPTLGHFISC